MSTQFKFQGDSMIATRTYDAPREAVFEAWVETSKVQVWWGCAQTTAVKSEIEQKVGGKYCHHMTIEGAGEVDMVGRILAFEPPSKLAYELVPPEGAPPDMPTMSVTVEFFERDGRTEVRLQHTGLFGDMKEIVKGGWTAALEKLDQFIATPA